MVRLVSNCRGTVRYFRPANLADPEGQLAFPVASLPSSRRGSFSRSPTGRDLQNFVDFSLAFICHLSDGLAGRILALLSVFGSVP